MDEYRITEQLIGAAIEVHRNLGPGLLEATYQLCLAHEVDLRGIPFARELAIGLEYKGLSVGCTHRADFVVAGKVIVALKAVESLISQHRAQLLTYLKWSGLKLGLLLNLNALTLRSGIRRVVNAI